MPATADPARLGSSPVSFARVAKAKIAMSWLLRYRLLRDFLRDFSSWFFLRALRAFVVVLLLFLGIIYMTNAENGSNVWSEHKGSSSWEYRKRTKT
jgi:hypothetical protein